MTGVQLKRVTVHGLQSARNNEADVLDALREEYALSPGLRLTCAAVELIVGACEPALGGNYAAGATEVTMADTRLRVLQKVHVLPYKDTFRYNYDFMYHEHIVPYFNSQQQGEFGVGFEFSSNGVRFQVVGAEPEGTYGVVGEATTIFYEGPPVERKVLERLHLLPYEDALPERYKISKLQLDDEALVRDYVKPHFEQRSAPVAPGEAVEIRGVTFKVLATRPCDGGGVNKDTEISCKGLPLRAAFAPGGAKAKAKAKAKGKAEAAARTTPGETASQCIVA